MTISITINDTKLSLEPGYTVIQACEMAGIEIPRFCYHNRLKIAGNCRMCLVEIEGGPPKPVASCAMPITDGMVVHTNTEMVKKARQGVMEFLLINHPLDCPICDQGGECDLQDQAMLYGRGKSRFAKYKRAVPQKWFGPLIKTEMNRCIHCTRCVRFLSDIAGKPEIGTIGRGEDMEISTYIKKSISSNMSGNIIDLCPVGALTSRPYAFTARSWELEKTETIDVLDAVCSNIRVDVRGRSVMRVLPRLNEDINEEWISDKTRFAYDGLRLQRLDRPYIKNKHGKLEECSWRRAIFEVTKRLKETQKQRVCAIAGDLVDVESAFALKALMNGIGVQNLECRQDGANFNASCRAFYTFNTTISGIDKSDFCLIVGANIGLDAPIIEARIRGRYLQKQYGVANIGAPVCNSFKTEELGDDPHIVKEILQKNHRVIDDINAAQFPMMIIGADIFKRKDASQIFNALCQIAQKFGFIKNDWNGFNILQRSAGRCGALDVGFVSDFGVDKVLDGAEFVYLLGADECIDKIPKDAFVVYQGHHGDNGAKRADVILPGAAYTEKDAIYVNTEGRAQYAYRATFAPGQAKEDCLIIRDLADNLNLNLAFNDQDDIRDKLCKIGDQFKNIGQVNKNFWPELKKAELGAFSDEKIKASKYNFYMTDPITRASAVMAKCSQEFYIKHAQ